MGWKWAKGRMGLNSAKLINLVRWGFETTSDGITHLLVISKIHTQALNVNYKLEVSLQLERWNVGIPYIYI
jgi:hypothetical protein